MNERNRKIVNILITVFLLGVTALFVYQSVNRPRILILHSYDNAYPWVRDVNVGLMRVLGKKQSYSLRWQYMDLKLHPGTESRRMAGITARRIIDQWNPDVLIAVDDEAQDLVGRFYVNRPDIKIVFAGVNGEAADYGYDHADNVTGILERKQLAAFKTALLDIVKLSKLDHTPRLINIADQSPSLVYDDKNLKKFDWKPVQLVESDLVGTYPEWQKAVLDAGSRADFIMLSNYRQLARSSTDPTLVPPKEIMEWTEANTKIPVIGTNGFNVEDGGVLAIGVSPYEQGQVAGRMAVDIIDFGKKPKSLPVATTQQFVVAMRANELKKKNIRLPAIYEAFARGTNNNF
jgi:ABC-type uncharacterized transport system substrate-binding protein